MGTIHLVVRNVNIKAWLETGLKNHPLRINGNNSCECEYKAGLETRLKNHYLGIHGNN